MEAIKETNLVSLLKTIKEEEKLSVTELAEKLGTHPNYLSTILSGKKSLGTNMSKRVVEAFPGKLLRDVVKDGSKEVARKETKVIKIPKKPTFEDDFLDGIQNVSDLFKKVRDKKGLNIEQLSKDIGVSVAAIYQVEKGESSGKRAVKKLAQKYNLPVEECLSLIERKAKKRFNQKQQAKQLSSNVQLSDQLEYETVARGEVKITPRKKYETDLLKMIKAGEEDNAKFEILFKTEGDDKGLLLTIDKGVLVVSMG